MYSRAGIASYIIRIWCLFTGVLFLSLQCAMMETSGFKMEPAMRPEGWKFAATTSGALCATMTLMKLMAVWPADSWDSPSAVRIINNM